MISLEQVQLLEERVSKAIDYVNRVNEENAVLKSEKENLIQKLDATQKRIDELEGHILRFKEDQSRIEDGIIAALDRLSQFEEAFENSLKDTGKKKDKQALPKKTEQQENEQQESQPEQAESKEIYFELKEEKNEEDSLHEDASSDDSANKEELDIF